MAEEEAYGKGTRLERGDFSSDYYFPWGKWDYAVVEDVRGDSVDLRYVSEDPDESETMTFTREEMGEMLSPGAKDAIEVEEDGVSLSEGEIEDIAYNSPAKEKNGPYELLEASVPAFVEVHGGRVRRLWAFADRERCEEAFRGRAGR